MTLTRCGKLCNKPKLTDSFLICTAPTVGRDPTWQLHMRKFLSYKIVSFNI